MAQRPKKTSNYVGKNRTNIERYIEDFDKDLKNIFNYLSLQPKFYNQAAEPNLRDNDWAFWLESGTPKYYLVVNFNSTQVKVELS